MVPVGPAFGEMAGLPLAGLYAGILPLIAYAFFGGSRQLMIGPDASMAALVAVSGAPLAGGDAGRLAVMASLLAVLSGMLRTRRERTCAMIPEEHSTAERTGRGE